MSGIKILLLGLVLSVLVLFTIQNGLEPLSIIVFGSATIELPRAVWMAIFMAAGVLTSLVIQLLHAIPASATPEQRLRRPQRESPEPKQAKINSRESRFEKNRQASESKSDWETPQNPDWGSKEEHNDEWNIEDPPRESTRTSIRLDKQEREKEQNNYEIRRQPTSSSNSGSVYSYGYQEPDNSGVGKQEKVYDAQYRMIRPPLRQPNQPQENQNVSEEDWGFDDEEGSDEER